MTLASIIVNNHNYGRFIRDAIESALRQTYAQVEVIVVDDGSTDDSREVIDSYSSRVQIVYKENGGQASALNAGLRASSGDVIIFLDSDDMLLPRAVEATVRELDREEHAETVKVHWPLWVVDQEGRRTGRKRPEGTLPAGDLRAAAAQRGPATMLSSPTSGNAWRREFLMQFAPIPEDVYRICADKYLIECAFFAGSVARLTEPQGMYRAHGRNRQRGANPAERLQRELRLYDHYATIVQDLAASRGMRIDTAAWVANSWWHQQARALEELEAASEDSDAIVLIDDDRFEGAPIGAARALPFSARGTPVSSEEAIAQVEQHRESGVRWLAIAWPAFWWLDHYQDLARHLRGRYRCVLSNNRALMFDLDHNEENPG